MMRPVTLIAYPKPAARLRVAIIRDHVVANLLVVIPNLLLIFQVGMIDARCESRLLAKIESFPISNEKISRHDTIGR